MNRPIVRGVWTLLDKNNCVVREGDTISSFRGEQAVVTGGTPPAREGSTGRVAVKWAAGHDQELYPGVFNLRWTSADFS